MYKDGIPERLRVTEELFKDFETFCEENVKFKLKKERKF
jgi:hypothetical protein